MAFIIMNREAVRLCKDTRSYAFTHMKRQRSRHSPLARTLQCTHRVADVVSGRVMKSKELWMGRQNKLIPVFHRALRALQIVHHHQTETQTSNISGKPQRNVRDEPNNCLWLPVKLFVYMVFSHAQKIKSRKSCKRAGDVP